MQRQLAGQRIAQRIQVGHLFSLLGSRTVPRTCEIQLNFQTAEFGCLLAAY